MSLCESTIYLGHAQVAMSILRPFVAITSSNQQSLPTLHGKDLHYLTARMEAQTEEARQCPTSTALSFFSSLEPQNVRSSAKACTRIFMLSTTNMSPIHFDLWNQTSDPELENWVGRSFFLVLLLCLNCGPFCSIEPSWS